MLHQMLNRLKQVMHPPMQAPLKLAMQLQMQMLNLTTIEPQQEMHVLHLANSSMETTLFRVLPTKLV